MAEVKIISGERNSGKTSFIKKLLESGLDAKGFITVAFDEKKDVLYLQDIASGEKRLLMETSSWKENGIGRYSFHPETFEWAEKKLSEIVSGTIVIDEVGRLELSGKGFDSLLWKLLCKDVELYVSVRKDYIGNVVEHYGLDSYQLIDIKRNI